MTSMGDDARWIGGFDRSSRRNGGISLIFIAKNKIGKRRLVGLPELDYVPALHFPHQVTSSTVMIATDFVSARRAVYTSRYQELQNYA